MSFTSAEDSYRRPTIRQREIVGQARDVYGPWKVNCHTLVGLGESDRELMGTFERLLERQIFS